MSDLYANQLFHPMPGLSYMPMMGFTDVFTEERLSFEDARRMQSFYPEMAQEIQRHVEDACDQMEYEGSMMFDEYPDRLMIQRITMEIYEQVRDLEEAEEENADRMTEDGELVSMQFGGPGRPGGPGGRRPGRNPLRDVIQILLLDEMHRRRCRHRRCRRFW